MLLDYIKPKNVKEFDDLLQSTRSSIPTAVFGVSEPLKIYLTALAFDKAIYIAKDSLVAKRVAEELENLTGKKSVFLPAKDDVLLFKKNYNKDSLYKRLTALYEIINGASYVTCSFEALLQLCPKSVDSFDLKIASDYALDKLLKNLVEMGYTRKEFVESKGDFSLRGDILDIFPINSETAFRCDFFGDELEKIRIYDAYQQKSGDEVRSFSVVSGRDYSTGECDKTELKTALTKSLKGVGAHVLGKAKQIVDELKNCLDSTDDGSLAFAMPLLPHAKHSVFDLFQGDFAVVIDECKMATENLDGLIREHTERVLSLSRGGQSFEFSNRHYYDKQMLVDEINRHPVLCVQTLTTMIPLVNVLQTTRINMSPMSRYAMRPKDLATDVKNWKKSAYKVVIFCGNSSRADKTCESLASEGVLSIRTDTPSEMPGVYVSKDYLTSGFVLHDGKLVVIGTGDAFIGIKEKKVKLRRKDTFSAPNVGDYAVHEHHGIGVVRGTERISTTEGTKDYVTLEYSGGDLLHIPVEQLDRLTKYLGGETAPKLSRLGGGEFERVKQRVRESISEMSINLKQLYRDRAEKKGFAFSSDNELTREFDELFEFEETQDQLQSINEIKRDMESNKVMDRLLCGDVGFGKTEVAIRACFKAILDGKQVAFVAPTTILTEQHYNTCVKRFDGFGVRIALLNRFTPQIKLKKYIEEIADGTIDLIIGTHKLFSKEIKFKDLGLLVLDEEQCFGVEHKERLRVLKTNVDTLTMTATPIPRTLHMSLSGIRDISLINTPPTNRIPVQSYVLEESDELIRDAVTREVAREGQVFILFNRVEQIYHFADHIKDILSDVRIVVAHGQMPKNRLEEAINSFYHGEYDVLISTTIIENGIDLPTANTLIVIDADKLGLFTLYQLKGRVGRSDKMAHAYFTYKQDKVLQENAYKRLSALMEYSELGSGYKIAMRDLEIRGAGNVLGKEQHGHMDKIGYELYSKLLKEQMNEITRDFETELDVRMDAYIPESYIENASSRLDAYKLISEISSSENAKEIVSSLKENYGELPIEAINLVSISLLKIACKKARIFKAFISTKQAFFEVVDFESLNGGLQNSLEKYKEVATLTFADRPLINFHICENQQKTLSLMTEFLNFSFQ